MENFKSEFEKFLKSGMGHTMTERDQIMGAMAMGGNNNTSPKNSIVPYVIEERKLNVTQLDVFSRLIMDRIIWFSGPVTSQLSPVIQAQLIFLENLSKQDSITMYLDTPGGEVKAGLSILDTMHFITPSIDTINTGLCASMGSVLLSGATGSRSSLPSSRVMMHMVSYGAQGNVQDVEITAEQARKSNFILCNLLGDFTGKNWKDIMEDCKRDKWLDSYESKEYGLIDNVVEFENGKYDLKQLNEDYEENRDYLDKILRK